MRIFYIGPLKWEGIFGRDRDAELRSIYALADLGGNLRLRIYSFRIFWNILWQWPTFVQNCKVNLFVQALG
jgi:hypothetical protein